MPDSEPVSEYLEAFLLMPRVGEGFLEGVEGNGDIPLASRLLENSAIAVLESTLRSGCCEVGVSATCTGNTGVPLPYEREGALVNSQRKIVPSRPVLAIDNFRFESS